jgi:lamin B
MASKSKRASTATPVPLSQGNVASGTSTPVNLSGSQRPGSPYSPTRVSRIQEKTELQNLNDRLACYIDRVRNLETENSRLIMERETSRETVTREVFNIKSMYENELSDARKLLDETAREKAKLEIDTTRLWEENDDLKKRLDKKTKDLLIAENNYRLYETRFTDLNGKYGAACSERNKALDDLKELEKECERLRKLMNEARKNLEEETLARVDLENNVQSLREELTFKDQVHHQELTETRTRRQVEISEIDGRLTEEYQAKLQESLQELRDQYESQMRTNRDEIEALYDNKYKSLEKAAQRNSNNAAATMEELRQTRVHIDGLNQRINELEAGNASLQTRIRDLERTLSAERNRHAEERALLEAELQRLRDEMAYQLQEYQDLMDTKVSLDLEIAAYDKLLKGEECRLNIGTSPGSASQLSQNILSTSHRSASARRTPSRAGGSGGGPAGKRKRTVLEESSDRQHADYSITSSAKSDIEISEQDPDGKFIKLFNKSNNEVSLGGWQLVRKAGTNETVFKFHRSVKIEGNSSITVWSSDAPGVTHEPPSNIVMKTQKWFNGDNIKTQLLNSSGEELAFAERIRHTSSSHIARLRETEGGGGMSGLSSYTTGATGFGSEEIFHQQGDPRGTEKCFIM